MTAVENRMQGLCSKHRIEVHILGIELKDVDDLLKHNNYTNTLNAFYTSVVTLDFAKRNLIKIHPSLGGVLILSGTLAKISAQKE